MNGAIFSSEGQQHLFIVGDLEAAGRITLNSLRQSLLSAEAWPYFGPHRDGRIRQGSVQTVRLFPPENSVHQYCQ